MMPSLMLLSVRSKMKPVNDKLKVKVATDEYGFGGEATGVERGTVVAIPEEILYFGFHSFAFEKSIAAEEVLKVVHQYYKKFLGKTVYWESLQDRGRRFKEGDEEFVFLNMTDVIAYSEEDIDVVSVDQVGSAGSFNLS